MHPPWTHQIPLSLGFDIGDSTLSLSVLGELHTVIGLLYAGQDDLASTAASWSQTTAGMFSALLERIVGGRYICWKILFLRTASASPSRAFKLLEIMRASPVGKAGRVRAEKRIHIWNHS